MQTSLLLPKANLVRHSIENNKPHPSPQFGQCFIGESGTTLVLEPNQPFNKGDVLYQPKLNETLLNAPIYKAGTPDAAPVYKLGSSPLVALWTQVIENYGPMFNKGTEGFYALRTLFRQSLMSAGSMNPLNMVPPIDRQQAFATLTSPTTETTPFNNGLKLDLKH